MAIEIRARQSAVEDDRLSFEVHVDGERVFEHTAGVFDPFDMGLSVEVAKRKTVVAYLENVFALPSAGPGLT